jgi:hypothetical protein
LKKAPKPLALFAANDQLALAALAICKSVGLAVPGHVAIVGDGDNLLAPDTMEIPISSVDTNLEMVGDRGNAGLNGAAESDDREGEGSVAAADRIGGPALARTSDPPCGQVPSPNPAAPSARKFSVTHP